MVRIPLLVGPLKKQNLPAAVNRTYAVNDEDCNREELIC